MAKNGYAHSESAVYGFGLIGAVIYYVHQSTSFYTLVVGLLKAVAWPGFLVYHLLGYLKV